MPPKDDPEDSAEARFEGEEAAPEADADEPAKDESELDRALREAAEFKDHLQRVQAEFENYRKRVSRERLEVGIVAVASLVEKLLEVLDEFELAVSAMSVIAEDHDSVAPVLKGAEAVYAKLLDTLRKEGLERIDESNVAFDANIHQAVAHNDDGDSDADLIVSEVFRPGYRLGPRVIRAAMVKVGYAKNPAG